MRPVIIKTLAFFVFAFSFIMSFSQQEISIDFATNNGLAIHGFKAGNQLIQTTGDIPFFSVWVDEMAVFSTDAKNTRHFEGSMLFNLNAKIDARLKVLNPKQAAWEGELTFSNISTDTLVIENLVPFGESEDHIYITSTGPWDLARSKIFMPGPGPIGIILPDNAWELGYAAIETSPGNPVYALARRTSWENAKRHRCKTDVFPGGKITWKIWMESYTGIWQNGLRKAFQERWLYDLEYFDNSLFEREDLQWIKHDYLITLQMAWDHEFYDALSGEYNIDDFLAKSEELMGGYDVYSLWPTWPRLGIDQRNQWDLYEDLPGGLVKIREISQSCKDRGTMFFIAFNPWDRSTREENPYQGMARLIEATDADGVVLDTRGASSFELQHAADSIRPGVVMYSEGMAIPKNMPGIVAGRVHDAIYMPPPLNLNKLIKPDFGIFRVCQLSQGRIHREVNISLFNGYGVELNTYYPGRPDWMEEEFIYLGKIVKILRENSSAFNNYGWIPLLPALRDSIWVNHFPSDKKNVYTIYSLIPEGFAGALFEAKIPKNHHAVSLWHHEEIVLDTLDGKLFPEVKTSAFDKSWIGTRRESNIDVICVFPKILNVEMQFDSLFISADKGKKIIICKENPDYQSHNIELQGGSHAIKISDHFGNHEGKIVIQLFDGENQLMDERVVVIPSANCRLISRVERTSPAQDEPQGMKKIPAGTFIFNASNPDQFIPYPKNSEGDTLKMQAFFMDEFPVTNAAYAAFLQHSKYKPTDETNFLKHWSAGEYQDSLANFPVVYISPEDAAAYCKFYQKRLPTEAEWQYAAQGSDGRAWPWGNDFDSTLCNAAQGFSTPVDQFPGGASPFGIKDMIGNVWQITNDTYDNGSYYYTIMKGGSFYKPTSSWWYVKGGPQPVYHQQMLLRVSPGFDRNSTVGFRCVKDTEK